MFNYPRYIRRIFCLTVCTSNIINIISTIRNTTRTCIKRTILHTISIPNSCREISQPTSFTQNSKFNICFNSSCFIIVCCHNLSIFNFINPQS